jgi:hypothetical protein
MTSVIPGERVRLTALRGAWLFDGAGPALIPDPVVVIEGSVIRDVCSGGRIPETPVGATVIDLPGVCGLGHRKGRIAPGFDADILAVDGDPVAEPEALHRIRAVYARGTAVARPGG